MNLGKPHPDPVMLEAFALGRLSTRQLRNLEAHLSGCPTCARAVMAIPDDRLIKSLRRLPDTAQRSQSCS